MGMLGYCRAVPLVSALRGTYYVLQDGLASQACDDITTWVSRRLLEMITHSCMDLLTWSDLHRSRTWVPRGSGFCCKSGPPANICSCGAAAAPWGLRYCVVMVLWLPYIGVPCSCCQPACHPSLHLLPFLPCQLVPPVPFCKWL